MNFYIYHPEDALRPFVKQYYYWEDNSSGLIQLPQHLFALGDQYMVFIQQGEAAVKPVNHAGFTLPQNAVIGHFTCACHLQVKGPVKMVIVQLNAYGCYRFLGMNMQSFTNYYRNLAANENPLWMQLSQQLEQIQQPADIISILNNTYQQAMVQHHHPLKQVNEMVDYLLANHGNVSPEELSHAFQLSRPTMERIFTSVTGLPPQLYARMVRYKTALRSLQQLNLSQWQANLAKTAYYSQAMFIKDYLEFNGETPSYFARSGAATIAHMPVPGLQQVAVAS
ncbi:helix-turn-helix domain-containing protein [Chitinophaga sp. MM2321]|uniref:helix-turn-helix domain-containing protein n=1 Tax=Chitinophaga sp. MM2321 TaxID=3137178 RepID=UPI0032D5AAB4